MYEYIKPIQPLRQLHIEGTLSTPNIILDKETSTFCIDGPILTNDAEQFFTPVLEWLEMYSKNANDRTNIHFNIEYFDISCGKRILFILYKLRDIVRTGKRVRVHWHYKSEDFIMQEIGEDFAMMMYDIPFHFAADIK